LRQPLPSVVLPEIPLPDGFQFIANRRQNPGHIRSDITQVAFNHRKLIFECIGYTLLICFHNYSKVVAVYKIFDIIEHSPDLQIITDRKDFATVQFGQSGLMKMRTYPLLQPCSRQCISNFGFVQQLYLTECRSKNKTILLQVDQ
jgi:hypothetical protein